MLPSCTRVVSLEVPLLQPEYTCGLEQLGGSTCPSGLPVGALPYALTWSGLRVILARCTSGAEEAWQAWEQDELKTRLRKHCSLAPLLPAPLLPCSSCAV